MTDWTQEEDEAFNMVEKQSNLGKQILRELGQPYVYEPKREWVNLTNEEIGEIYRVGWANNMELARAIEAKLKEKNERTL
jgi:hypothetical protein